MGDVLLVLYSFALLGILGIILFIISFFVGLKKISGKVIFVFALLCLAPSIFLIFQKHSVENDDWDKLGPLLQAIDKKNCREVESLLDNGYDANEDLLYTYPSTPLTYAVSEGDLCTVKLLLERGAEVNVRANNGGIPLNNAIFRGDTSILICLLENGADVSLKEGTVPPLQPIEYATIRLSRDKSIVEILLRHGADPNAASSSEGTPLQGAIRRNNAGVVQCLLENGANPSLGEPIKLAEKMLERFKKGELAYLKGGQKNMEVIIDLLKQFGAEQ